MDLLYLMFLDALLLFLSFNELIIRTSFFFIDVTILMVHRVGFQVEILVELNL